MLNRLVDKSIAYREQSGDNGPMVEDPQKDRIPLPPILLSMAPLLALPLAALLAFALYQPFGRVGAFLGLAFGLIVPIVWLAKRVRGRDVP